VDNDSAQKCPLFHKSKILRMQEKNIPLARQEYCFMQMYSARLRLDLKHVKAASIYAIR